MDGEGKDGAMLDLLGDPVQAIRDPRGRPSFGKSKENQLLVISLRGAGWTQSMIATYMRCDEKTLRKHFSRELDAGALFLDGMAIQVLVKKMLDGHVGATKEIREIAAAGNAPRKPGDVDKAKAALLGKKEQLVKDSQQPPKDWGDLLPSVSRDKH